MIGVNIGDGFALAFNVSWSLFGPSAEDIAPWLERMNLARGVISEQPAGVINPWINVIGQAAGNWAAPSSFRDALLAAIGELGFEIDYNSVSYRITPKIRPTTPAPAPTQRPSSTPTLSMPSEEAVYFDIAGEPPRDPYTPPTPPKEDKGVSSLVWLGFGLLAVVLIARD